MKHSSNLFAKMFHVKQGREGSARYTSKNDVRWPRLSPTPNA